MFLYKTHIKVKFLVKVYGRKIICKGLKNQINMANENTKKVSTFKDNCS